MTHIRESRVYVLKEKYIMSVHVDVYFCIITPCIFYDYVCILFIKNKNKNILEYYNEYTCMWKGY